MVNGHRRCVWPSTVITCSRFGDVGEEHGFEESEWVEAVLLWWEPGGGGVDVSAGIKPSFIRFFCFMRRFWNHIFTWVSLSCNAVAISMRLARVRYLLKWNSFSNSVSCLVVKLVRPVLLAPPPAADCAGFVGEQLLAMLGLPTVVCPLKPYSVGLLADGKQREQNLWVRVWSESHTKYAWIGFVCIYFVFPFVFRHLDLHLLSCYVFLGIILYVWCNTISNTFCVCQQSVYFHRYIFAYGREKESLAMRTEK